MLRVGRHGFAERSCNGLKTQEGLRFGRVPEAVFEGQRPGLELRKAEANRFRTGVQFDGFADVDEAGLRRDPKSKSRVAGDSVPDFGAQREDAVGRRDHSSPAEEREFGELLGLHESAVGAFREARAQSDAHQRVPPARVIQRDHDRPPLSGDAFDLLVRILGDSHGLPARGDIAPDVCLEAMGQYMGSLAQKHNNTCIAEQQNFDKGGAYLAREKRRPMKIAATALLFAALAAPLAAQPTHAPWSYKSVIYELNTRQFSKSGKFAEVGPRAAELRRLGVDIVWFMPIHPIGAKNRKGTLGSPYSITDYSAVNPEFGTLEDFKSVVAAFHAQGMHVIIDVVANHTAWDHPWATAHPDWYKHDAKGNFVPPYPDWKDVIKLDYSKPELRKAMIEMLEDWVRDVGVDGFRCDVAGEVPTSFWEEARAHLDRIRPVFMLAEAEKPELLRKAFDADYASESFHIMHKLIKGKAKVADLGLQVLKDQKRYPRGSWRMQFSSNHDQNTWLDSDIHLYGSEGARAMAALTYCLPGLPLIYNGQEVGNAKKIEFFERDPINWKTPSRRDFYAKWTGLFHAHPALSGGDFHLVGNDRTAQVLSFRRQAGDEKLLVAANLSGSAVDVQLDEMVSGGSLVDAGRLRAGRTHLLPWHVEVYKLGLEKKAR